MQPNNHNYYTCYNYVSNSELSYLDRLLNCQTQLEGNFLAFGNLFDAIVTEPDKVDLQTMELTLAFDEKINFTLEDLNVAAAMKHSLYKNKFVANLFGQLEFQKELYIDQFLIESDIAMFHLPVRCKYDGYAPHLSLGVDLKSTACTSQRSFINSIEQFDYDRQAAWYMDLGNLNKFLFVAVSKKGKHDVFMHAIQRGDQMYISGRAKYQRLAYYYDMLVIR